MSGGEREPLLTEVEHEAMRLTADLANALRRIITDGDGGQAANDWSEAAHLIHSVQNMILAQAAARAYPNLYRPLGGWPEGGDPEGSLTHPPLTSKRKVKAS